FAANRALDATIDERFRDLHDRLAAGLVTPRLDSAHETLAAILVLDQFSRHLYRGSPRAYACDVRARELTRHAVESGLHDALTPPERLFAYMPLQHSEDRLDQAESVRLVDAIGNPEWTAFAVAHRDVVERFGRFPHRNEVLGRMSTPEEMEAVAAGAAW
ncbi:MAG: hypothetical protein K0R70_284, partial [Steroidobacteraceae bacterium]|nr:hypothetical protein [Steroidobacteraceae bacterium]